MLNFDSVKMFIAW